ncbi:hypothetical protein [Streptomyces lydicus]|uniref:hypothetical protein n=1 Tax=Streptomyces lydicus TaxID=47763 RepID=UPI0028705B5E|nr:hypothetical protein [Streptomyces lydicus]
MTWDFASAAVPVLAVPAMRREQPGGRQDVPAQLSMVAAVIRPVVDDPVRVLGPLGQPHAEARIRSQVVRLRRLE